jgi:Flp pilus assembly protein TadB
MPLDDAERSALEETERSLAALDPTLERRFRTGWEGTRRRRRGLAVVVGAVVLIAGLLWLGLMAQAVLIGALAVAVVVIADWWPAREIAARMHEHQHPGPR